MAKDMWAEIEKLGRQKAKELAEETAKELQQEALEQTYEFYDEYSPMYYKRHPGAGTDTSGMARSIEKVVKSSDHGRAYIGGIRISTDNMHTDYNGTPLQVLQSYLDGFHGLPTFGSYLQEIPSTRKFRYLERYKDSIIKRFK